MIVYAIEVVTLWFGLSFPFLKIHLNRVSSMPGVHYSSEEIIGGLVEALAIGAGLLLVIYFALVAVAGLAERRRRLRRQRKKATQPGCK